MLESPFLYNGMPVVFAKPKIVPRSWTERLFSRPWRPFQRTKIINTVADGHVYRVADSWLMTEATWKKLQFAIRRDSYNFAFAGDSKNSLYNSNCVC